MGCKASKPPAQSPTFSGIQEVEEVFTFRNRPIEMSKEKMPMNALVEALQNNPILAGQGFSKELFEEIAENMTAVQIKKGDVIYRTGDSPNELYILQEGLVTSNTGEKIGDRGKNGDKEDPSLNSFHIFGVEGFCSGNNRSSTMIVSSPGIMYYINLKDYSELTMVHRLSQMTFLNKISSYKLQRMSEHLHVEVFRQGETIVSKGASPRLFYIISLGSVISDPGVESSGIEVVTDKILTITNGKNSSPEDTNDLTKTELMPGEHFGSLEITQTLDNPSVVYRSSYIATSTVVLFTASKMDFAASHINDQVVRSDPQAQAKKIGRGAQDDDENYGEVISTLSAEKSRSGVNIQRTLTNRKSRMDATQDDANVSLDEVIFTFRAAMDEEDSRKRQTKMGVKYCENAGVCPVQ